MRTLLVHQIQFLFGMVEMPWVPWSIRKATEHPDWGTGTEECGHKTVKPSVRCPRVDRCVGSARKTQIHSNGQINICQAIFSPRTKTRQSRNGRCRRELRRRSTACAAQSKSILAASIRLQHLLLKATLHRMWHAPTNRRSQGSRDQERTSYSSGETKPNKTPFSWQVNH